jgi:hypothetical protein
VDDDRFSSSAVCHVLLQITLADYLHSCHKASVWTSRYDRRQYRPQTADIPVSPVARWVPQTRSPLADRVCAWRFIGEARIAGRGRYDEIFDVGQIKAIYYD